MENKYELERIKGTVQLPTSQGVVRKHKHSTFNWYFWSDQHFGSTDCNYKLAEKIVKTIEADKTALVTLGGDTIEAIPRGYKINEKGQHCGVDTQIIRTAKALQPIASQIIVLFSGNHNSMARGESLDSDLLIAQALNVPYKTVPTVTQVITPKGTVRAAGGHGAKSSKNTDLELEQVRNIFPGCAIYHLGHVHSLYCKQVGSLQYDSEGNEAWSPAWFLRTGNTLNYAEYARYSLYAPQRSGCVKMVIDGGVVVDGQIITEELTRKGRKQNNAT